MSIRRNVVANYLGQGWTTLMGLAFLPFYVKLLGLEAYGLVGIFVLLQAWLAVLDLGLTPTISREMARFTGGGHDPQSIRDLLRSVELVAGAVATGVAIVIVVSSAWAATNWLRVERMPPGVVAHALSIMGTVVGLRFVESIYRSSVIGLQRQVTLNILTSLLATLRAVGALAVLVWVSPTVHAFFLWQGLVSGVTVVTLGVLVHRSLPAGRRPATFSLTALRSVRGYMAGTVAVTLLGFMLSQSDKVILSSLLSLPAFGLYSLAYSGASTVRLLAQPIDQAVFPRLTQLHQLGDSRGLAELYHKSTQYNVVLLGGVGLFLAVFGQEVLQLWLQDAELARRAYGVFWLLVVGMVLNGIMNSPYNLQMAAGWTSLLAKVNAVMVVVFVPTIYVLTNAFDMTGAAVAWVMLNLTYVVTVGRLMHRRLLPGELRAWYTRDLLMPISAGAATALVVKVILPPENGVLAVVLLALALVGIVGASSLAAGYVRGALANQLRAGFRLAP